MTTVAILPESEGAGETTYQAVACNAHSTGRTAGEALDALTAQLGEEEAGPFIIVPLQRPDRCFSRPQQQRREELLAQWRAARDAAQPLPPLEQAELEKRVEAERQAATERARALLDERSRCTPLTRAWRSGPSTAASTAALPKRTSTSPSRSNTWSLSRGAA
jgi:hypothetical protein